MAVSIRLWMLVIMFVTLTPHSQAAVHLTCGPDSTIQTPRSRTRIYNMDANGKTDHARPVDVRNWGPQERFEYQSDSMRLRIHVGEIALNGRHQPLANWSFGQNLNWSDSLQDRELQYTNEQLSQRSTTYFFPISSGDTVSFYRSIYWSRISQRGPAPTVWIGPDNMYYSVELVDSATLSRIALIDTFEMLATTNTPGRNPSFFSWYPLASRVHWVAPAGIGTGRKALVRVNVRTAGSANHVFFRSDIYAGHQSFRDLGNAGWTAFMDAANASNVRSMTSGGIVVARVPGGVDLHCTTAADLVRVVDLTGATFWEGPAPSPAQPQHIPLAPGRYVACASQDGAMQGTFLFIVTP
jgi:hypothetical protein